MKHKLLMGVLLGCLTTLIFACNTKKEEASPIVIDKEEVKKEIQAKEDEFAATYNSGVNKSIGYYADDATSFYQNRAPLVGKQAIIEFLKSGLDSNSNKISFKTNEVFVSNDGNQVVEVGYFKVTAPDSSIVNSGNYMSLFEKRDGKYVSVRDMSASDIPLD